MLSGGAYEKRDYDKNSNILLFLYILNLNHNTFVLLAFFLYCIPLRSPLPTSSLLRCD